MKEYRRVLALFMHERRYNLCSCDVQESIVIGNKYWLGMYKRQRGVRVGQVASINNRKVKSISLIP